MVRGVRVCGAFFTEKTLRIILGLSIGVMVISIIGLIVSLTSSCYTGYSYSDEVCEYNLNVLFINSVVLLSFTGITVIFATVLCCKLEETSPMILPVVGQPIAVGPGYATHPVAVPPPPYTPNT